MKTVNQNNVQAGRRVKSDSEGIGAMWRSSTSAVSNTFKVVDSLSISMLDLSRSTNFQARSALYEQAEEFMERFGIDNMTVQEFIEQEFNNK